MPSLNFQEQFVLLIESGEKRQTIRPKRKNPIKAGDKLYLFSGMRTKSCKRIITPKSYFHRGRKYITHENMKGYWIEEIPYVICKSVERIRITHGMVEFPQRGTSYNIALDLVGIIKALAKADGFDNYYDMYDFFNKQYGLPFEGVLIKW